jgi:hypothetical protein
LVEVSLAYQTAGVNMPKLNFFEWLILIVIIVLFFTLPVIALLLFAASLFAYDSFKRPQSKGQATYNQPTVKLNCNPLMSAEEKAKYLSSPEWQSMRKAVHIHKRHQCEVCGSKSNLEVHHNTYKRLGNENIDDLNLLCRKHHQQIHDKLGYDRVTNYPISIFKE